MASGDLPVGAASAWIELDVSTGVGGCTRGLAISAGEGRLMNETRR
jgi:hypothetical protein